MLKGHHGVCGERGEGRETDRLGIEQTSVAMSRHVGDTDGRNSAGRSFDCLQSPPRPSLAHRRRTRLGAAARRTVRVSQSCWGFRGLLDAGRESVPHLRRRPTPSRGSGRRNLNPDRTPSLHHNCLVHLKIARDVPRLLEFAILVWTIPAPVVQIHIAISATDASGRVERLHHSANSLKRGPPAFILNLNFPACPCGQFPAV